MDKRAQLLTKVNFKQDLRILVIALALTLLAALGFPSLFSLSIKFDFSFFTGIYAMSIILLPWAFFDERFKQGLQNGFSRAQIFKAKLFTTLPWVIVLTIITIFTDGITVQNTAGNYINVYGNYFQSPVVNVMLTILLELVFNLLLIWGVQFLGAFFALFSKKFRKYMVIIVFAIMLMVLISSFIGGAMLVANNVIDRKIVLAATKLFAEIILGYNGPNSAFNPINPIVTSGIVTAILMYATRFIILRLQLHREA